MSKKKMSYETKENLKVAGIVGGAVLLVGGIISAVAVPLNMLSNDRESKIQNLNDIDNKIVNVLREKSGYSDFVPQTLQFEDNGNCSVLGTAKEKFGDDLATAYVRLSIDKNENSYKIGEALRSFQANVSTAKVNGNLYSGVFHNDYYAENGHDWDNYTNYYNLHNEILNFMENSTKFNVSVVGNSKDFNNALLRSCLFTNPTYVPQMDVEVRSFFTRVGISSELLSNGTALYNISDIEKKDGEKIFYVDYMKSIGDEIEAERAKVTVDGENLSDREAYDCFIYDLDNVKFSIVDTQKVDENGQIIDTEDSLTI